MRSSLQARPGTDAFCVNGKCHNTWTEEDQERRDASREESRYSSRERAHRDRIVKESRKESEESVTEKC